MAEASLNGASQEEPYRKETWPSLSGSSRLPSIPPLVKVSERIAHTLNCSSPRAWRSVMKDLCQMMESNPEQQEGLIETLLSHQRKDHNATDKYHRHTHKVLDGCQKILKTSLAGNTELCPKVLLALTNNALQHIQYFLKLDSRSEHQMVRVASYARTSIDTLRLIIAHIDKNPVVENTALNRKINLCFDLVVLDPSIIRESKLEGWHCGKLNNYAALIAFTGDLADQRFSPPLCHLLTHVKGIQEEIQLKYDSNRPEDLAVFSQNLQLLEDAILRGLSKSHYGIRATTLLGKEFAQYQQDSDEFNSLLVSLAQSDIAETLDGCEYLTLALIECDAKIRQSLLKLSFGEPLPDKFQSTTEKFEKLMRLMVDYLSYPGACDICFQIAAKLTPKERGPLITIFKIIQQNDPNTYLYLLPTSGIDINPPQLSSQESSRLKFLIDYAEKLPQSPFQDGREYLAQYL